MKKKMKPFFVELGKTQSGKFLLANLGNQQTTETHYLLADKPEGTWTCFAPRSQGVSYELEHHQDSFVFLCNENAPNFKLLSTPIHNTSRSNWQELIEHNPEIYLKSLYAFSNHLVITGRKDGLTQLWVHNMNTQNTKMLRWPEPLYAVGIGDNRLYDTDEILIGFQSMLSPHAVLELNLSTLTHIPIKQNTVLSYNPESYITQRLWATAQDGTNIPISLLYKKGLKQPAPLLLYGYGAYGASYDPEFNSNRLALLDRGLIFAIAHVRGGAEMGRTGTTKAESYKRKTLLQILLTALNF